MLFFSELAISSLFFRMYSMFVSANPGVSNTLIAIDRLRPKISSYLPPNKIPVFALILSVRLNYFSHLRNNNYSKINLSSLSPAGNGTFVLLPGLSTPRRALAK